jgi:hypothetical protein
MLASRESVGYEAAMSSDTAARINAAVEGRIRKFVEELTDLLKTAIRDLVADAASKIEVRAGAARARPAAARTASGRPSAARAPGPRAGADERVISGKKPATKAPTRRAGEVPPTESARVPRGKWKLPTTAGGKRTAAEMRRAEATVLAWVRAHPGQRVEPMAAALGVKTKDITRPLAKLVKSGAIRREGEKRATRYFPADGAASVGSDAVASRGAASGRTPTWEASEVKEAAAVRKRGVSKRRAEGGNAKKARPK